PISRPPICEGVASPDIMTSKALAASSRVSRAPLATFAMSALNSSMGFLLMPARRCAPAPGLVPGRGTVEEILQDQVPVLRGDALGMKLDAMHRQVFVREPHDEAVIGLRRHGELLRQGCAVEHQGMIARRLERPVDAAKHAAAGVANIRELPVDRRGSAHHVAAKRLTDRLMAEAHPEDR